MTKAFRRMGLGIGAAAVALLVAGVGYQHLSAQGPGPGGPGGRFGAPGRGFGGPGGPMMGRGGPGGGMLGPMFLGSLDLTSDQRDRVQQIMTSHQDEQRALGNRAMQAQEALQDAITGTFDESVIRARAADVAAVNADMAVAQGRIFNEVFQILTPDQQQKLKTMQADRKAQQEKMRKRRQDGTGRRGRA